MELAFSFGGSETAADADFIRACLEPLYQENELNLKLERRKLGIQLGALKIKYYYGENKNIGNPNRSPHS